MNNQIPRIWQSMLDATGILPVVVVSVARIHDSDWRMDKSLHDHYEVVLIKKGTAVFDVAGTKVTLSPNEVIFIKPFQEHSFSVPEGSGCEFDVLRFKFVQQDNDSARLSPEDFIAYVHPNERGFFKVKAGPKSEIANVLNRIMLEGNRTGEDGGLMNWLLFMELFVYLSRVLREDLEISQRTAKRNIHDIIEEARRYIEANYMMHIGLEEVARYAFLSPSYFARAFKSIYSVSPIRYLLNVRVSEAKTLLSQTDLKVGDIALKVGFSTQQRFNDVFKKSTGISPLEFRRSVKRDRLNK